MAPVITGLSPITETEAVNLMLRSIGEQPVADATVSTLPEVEMALEILKNVTRTSLAEGYTFNTEFGLRLYPEEEFATWQDADGTVVPINVFLPPAALISFSVTPTVAQQNPELLDLIIRKSKQYELANENVQVFYDRSNNRDGLPSSAFAYIDINPVWFVDFEDLPQEARDYIACRSARIFAENVPGSGTLAKFTSDDELAALRQIKRRYGLVDKYNMFRNAQNAAALGLPYRRFNGGGNRDLRTLS